jgi:hypothetical protein
MCAVARGNEHSRISDRPSHLCPCSFRLLWWSLTPSVECRPAAAASSQAVTPRATPSRCRACTPPRSSRRRGSP